MLTISDIARQLHLSTATVSNALTGKGRISEARRKEIVAAARDMGYDFGRIRASQPVCRSVCVIEEQAGIIFCDRIVQGICSAAEEQGIQVTLFNMNILTLVDWNYSPPDDLVRSMLRKTCERLDPSYMGMIYVSQYPRDMTDLMPHMPYPVICAYAYTDGGIPCINYDDQQGAFLAASHLTALGRRRIAMISGPVDSIPMTKRFAGYQRALIKAGLPFRPELICVAGWSDSSGQSAMEQLLSLDPRPDAVFCQSDYLAIGAIRAIRAAGLRVPEDIAIVGFDDIDAAALVEPPLTTIAPPHVEIGQEAVKKLLRIIGRSDDGDSSIKLQCRLLKRAST